jgi:putative colanic acid biosynthesis UDP-glucose lipid carrier transferase
MALLLFLLKIGSVYSRGWFILWFGLSVALAFAFRILLRSTVRHLRCKGFNQKNIVLVGGDNALGQRVFATLSQAHWLGFDIKGVFYQTDVLIPDAVNLGKIEQLAAYLAREKVDEVWITLPLRQIEQVQKVLNLLQNSTVNVRLVPDIFSLSLINHSMTEVAGLPVISLSSSPMTTGNRLLKAIEDKLLASLILLLIWPVMLVLAIGVKLSSKGPVFFRQERMSYNGQSFKMLKFRSMPIDVENKTGAVWAKAGESRATFFGQFLRRTSMDELPQFINVLKGDMSIVGPRPERSVFVEKFKDEIPLYMKKHMVKAGITGWAQINGWRGDTSLERRIECDLYYIENWSLLFDLKIIALTVFKGFIHKNAY